MNTVKIDYTNWKGIRSVRTIMPMELYWGSSEFHTLPCWLLEAEDLEKMAIRTFAMKDIHSWEELLPE